jgi:hypothetical protein
MGFVISASAPPTELLAHLRSLTAADLNNDRAGLAMRDFIEQGISECSASLEPHKVYTVRATGDSSSTDGFKLNVVIELGDRLDYVEPVPAPLSL